MVPLRWLYINSSIVSLDISLLLWDYIFRIKIISKTIFLLSELQTKIYKFSRFISFRYFYLSIEIKNTHCHQYWHNSKNSFKFKRLACPLRRAWITDYQTYLYNLSVFIISCRLATLPSHILLSLLRQQTQFINLLMPQIPHCVYNSFF